MNYDVLVVGMNPIGRQAAIAASLAGRTVVLRGSEQLSIWDPSIWPMEGTSEELVSLRSDLVQTNRRSPKQNLRRQTSQSGARRNRISIAETSLRLNQMIESVVQTQNERLERNRIRLIPHRYFGELGLSESLNAERVILAASTKPRRPHRLAPRGVLTIADLSRMTKVPAELTVIGAGRTGRWVSGLLALNGVRVRLIDQRESFVEIPEDADWGRALNHLGVQWVGGCEVLSVHRQDQCFEIVPIAGPRIQTAGVVCCVDRVGPFGIAELQRSRLGVDLNRRIWCDSKLRSWNEKIYVAGEMISAPQRLRDSRVSGILAARSALVG